MMAVHSLGECFNTGPSFGDIALKPGCSWEQVAKLTREAVEGFHAQASVTGKPAVDCVTADVFKIVRRAAEVFCLLTDQLWSATGSIASERDRLAELFGNLRQYLLKPAAKAYAPPRADWPLDFPFAVLHAANDMKQEQPGRLCFGGFDQRLGPYAFDAVRTLWLA